jgi:hypothetical protein
MSFIGDNIQNVRSKNFVDLLNNNLAPGGSIIIFTLNQVPSGTVNQQWRVTPVPAGKNLFTIQSVLTGLYASINGLADVNTPIISSAVSMPWEVEHAGDPGSHSFTIQVPNTNLFWNVSSDAPLTPISLAKQDGTTGQLWIPRTALGPA